MIGPAWTRGEIEKPEGVRNMGSYDALFYTEEQQRRLGVDESGAKVARDRSKFFAPEAAPAASGRFPEHWGRPPLKQRPPGSMLATVQCHDSDGDRGDP